MIAIYCRQSIDKKDSISIEAQIEAYKRLAVDDDFMVYSDKGLPVQIPTDRNLSD